MKRSEKIEYVQRFLQERIEKGFPYPFQVSGEENFFVFRLKNGKRECCARLRQTEELLDVLCEGTKAEREVLEEALVNTSFLYPPRIYCVEDIMSWEEKKHGDGRFMAEGEAAPFRKGARGYLLTNTLEINGAIALFYPGVLKKLSESLGEDFYIAFTSIHEAQIHAAGMISPDAVEASLRDTNRHCNRREEVLTDRVYCYRREKQRLGIIENGEFLEVKRDE